MRSNFPAANDFRRITTALFTRFIIMENDRVITNGFIALRTCNRVHPETFWTERAISNAPL